MKKEEFMKMKAGDLFSHVNGLERNFGMMQELIIEYKVKILYLQRKTNICEAKIEILQNTKHGKNVFRDLGRKHNRDISTMKRNAKKKK